MFWKLALQFAAQVMPWESIIAWVLNQVLAHHQKQLTAGKLDAVKLTTSRVVESASAFATVADTLVKSAETGQVQSTDVTTATTAVRAALDAWSNQAPTPATYKQMFRPAPDTEVPGLTPIVGDGTPEHPRDFAPIPGQVVLTQAST